MPADDLFVLNVNPDGEDTIHRNPREECNTDDAVGRQTVDAKTAAAMIASGHARTCQHCMPQEAT